MLVVGLAMFPVVFSSFVHGQQTVLSPYPPAQGFIIKCSCVNTTSYVVFAGAGSCFRVFLCTKTYSTYPR